MPELRALTHLSGEPRTRGDQDIARVLLQRVFCFLSGWPFGEQEEGEAGQGPAGPGFSGLPLNPHPLTWVLGVRVLENSESFYGH